MVQDPLSQRLGDRIWGYVGAGTPMEYSLGSVLDREERSPCPKDSVLPRAVGILPGTQLEAEVCENRAYTATGKDTGSPAWRQGLSGRGCGGLGLKKMPLFWFPSENQCALLLLP